METIKQVKPAKKETHVLSVPTGLTSEESSAVLTREALGFVVALHRKFDRERRKLLKLRTERQAQVEAGAFPRFLPETQEIRDRAWQVAEAPLDLQDRRVEITGPVERKMMINALNSGARVFMADFEDSLSPSWANIILGQANLKDAVRRKLEFTGPGQKAYRLHPAIATLVVRPRGWHLEDKHILVDGAPISASLLDFGLYCFHNAKELLDRGTGPYFYLPKLQSHLEARLWNEVFNFSEDELGIRRGAVRATVLIETIFAAFEMEEILFELREHATGLNAGRWDYIFSIIKTFRNAPELLLPDRSQVTMGVPFMRAYTDLLIQTCHRRGTHALGGMAAFIPDRKDPEWNETALAKVREDKEREATRGFDGTWVAHPDLVPIALGVFNQTLGTKAHQKDRLLGEVSIAASSLLDVRLPGSQITEEGLRNNVSVALQYIEQWLSGTGAVAIHHLMEDTATAEIARAQIWQWIRHGARLTDGRTVTTELYERIRDEELTSMGKHNGAHLAHAIDILDGLIKSKEFTEFLTPSAYRYLE